MQPEYKITQNWLTLRPKNIGLVVAAFLSLVLALASQMYWRDLFHAQELMLATKHLVITNHQYWRAWSALWAHSDLGHLLNNALLLIPLSYLLAGYYGLIFFPIVGVFFGGLTNLIVLASMAPHTALLGVSGVVNWMGAAWLTLFLLIDRRHSPRRRWAHVIFLSLILFIPEKYEPQISYYSHFLGFIFGIISALGYYSINRHKFLAAEVIETVKNDEAADIVSEQT